jgi:hypothetical protein
VGPVQVHLSHCTLRTVECAGEPNLFCYSFGYIAVNRLQYAGSYLRS